MKNKLSKLKASLVDNRSSWIVFLFLAIIFGGIALSQNTFPSIKLGLEESSNPQDFSLTVKIVILMTILSLAPSIIMMMTLISDLLKKTVKTLTKNIQL